MKTDRRTAPLLLSFLFRSLSEAVSLTGVSEPTIRRDIKSGKVSSEKDGRADLEKPDRMCLDKLKVVLAFPDENLAFIKKGVVRQKRIADEGLRPIEKSSERTKIKTDARLGSIVQCVMRNGLVVVGEKVWDSRYYMVMRVGGKKGKGGKILIAYKHALLDFYVLKESQKRKKRYSDDWDDENTRRD